MGSCSSDHPLIRFDVPDCPLCSERKLRAEVDGWGVLRDLLAAADAECQHGNAPQLPPRNSVPVSLGVVVPVRNRDIRACLQSLAYQTEPAEAVLVSDLGSNDPRRIAGMARTGGAQVLRQESDRWIKGQAVNPAVRRLSGVTHVLILDADIILHPDALARIRQWLGVHLAVAVAPDDVGSHPINIDPAGYDRLSMIRRPRGRDQVGGVVAFRRNWLLEAGGICEDFAGWGYQDIDLWRRAEAAGPVLVVPNSGLALHQAHGRPASHKRDCARNLALYEQREEQRVSSVLPGPSDPGWLSCAAPLVGFTGVDVWTSESARRGPVVVSMPTIPGREAGAERVLRALLPQMGGGDWLHVCLNGPVELDVGAIVDELQPEVAWCAVEHPANAGPLHRFVVQVPDGGYLLTVDDDIDYPADYIARTVDALQVVDAVSWHVRWWPDAPRVRVPSDRSLLPYHSRSTLRIDQASDEWIGSSYGGCGAMGLRAEVAAWVLDSLNDDSPAWRFERCDDLWVSQAIGTIYRPPSGAGWIQIQQPHPTGTLYDDARAGGFRERQQLMSLLTERGWCQQPIRRYGICAGRLERIVDVCFGITAYNRPELLADLLRDIDTEAARAGLVVSVVVVDDASDSAPKLPGLGMQHASGYCVQMPERGGKRGFHRLVTRLYEEMGHVPADLYVQLPDDARLCRDFIDLVRDELNIVDDCGIALNLLIDSGRGRSGCWTGVEPEQHMLGTWHAGWVDGASAFRRAYLEVLDFRVPPIPDWWHNAQPPRGSGVGWAISRALVHLGLHQVDKSLIALVDVPSEMNSDVPRATENGRLLTRDYVDGEEELRALAHRRIAIVDWVRFWTHGPADHISRCLLAGVWYERPLLEQIAALDLEGVYLDVGANIGVHAVWYASRCRATKVHAYEPLDQSYDLLARNLEPWCDRADARGAAVGKDGQRLKFGSLDRANVGMATLQPDRQGTVVSSSLDALYPDDDDVALIKLDIEGGELAALRGGWRLIRRCRPVVVVEAHTEERLAELMKTRALKGYTVAWRGCATPTYLLAPPEGKR